MEGEVRSLSDPDTEEGAERRGLLSMMDPIR